MNKDTITLFPTSFDGEVKAPPSKSLSHRAIICAGLSKGTSRLSNIVYSDDIIATMNAMEQLGVEFHKRNNSLHVRGLKHFRLSNDLVDCNESGSTIRFLIPLFSLTNKLIRFTGKKSLLARPQSIYEDIYKSDGNTFELKNDILLVKGSIKPRNYLIDGGVSSQFISGLLFALPLLNDDSTITIQGNLESKSYIDLTISTLKTFGISILETSDGYFIKGNQEYASTNYYIEGDYSQGAFHLVGGVIGGRIKVEDLDHESQQGDKAIVDTIQAMGGRVVFMENGYTTEKTQTHSSIIDIEDCPDIGPIIALLASVSKGTTHIINAHRLRIKESDRIKSTVETLKSLGANITSKNDEIIVTGRNMLEGGVTVDSYNDHRIAMMVSIASSRCNKEVILTGASAVNKSYPHFFEDFKAIGGKYK